MGKSLNRSGPQSPHLSNGNLPTKGGPMTTTGDNAKKVLGLGHETE